MVRNKKHILFFGVFVVFAALSFPLGANAFVHADIIPFLLNIGILIKFGIPIFIVTAVAYALAVVSALLAQAVTIAVGDLLVQTLNVAVVPGKTVGIVQMGWEFSRDFVNMFLLLMLVFIGLATMLRLTGYGFQRALPKLILVALLVNFSAVLVGLVVDVGNLFTNFFVSRIGSFNLIGPTLATLVNDLPGEILNIFQSSLDNPLQFLTALVTPLAKAAILSAFFLIFLLILFIVALIFLARIAVLWILVIFAPFAFAAAIFPATQRFWNLWRDQLVLWSIIGIPISFFLYLATWLASNSTAVEDSLNIAKTGGLSDVIVALFAPAITLLTLMIGVGISLSLAPTGAQGIIRFGRSVPGRFRKSRVGKNIEAGSARFTAKSLQFVESPRAMFGAARGTRMGGWAASKTQESKRAQAVGGWATRQTERAQRVGAVVGEKAGRLPGAKPLGRATRAAAQGAGGLGLGRMFVPGLLEHAAKTERITLPSGFKDWTDEEKINYVKSANLAGSELLQGAAEMGDAWTKDPDLKQKVEAARARYAGDSHYANSNREVSHAAPQGLTEEVAVNMAMAPKITKEAKEEAKKQATGSSTD